MGAIRGEGVLQGRSDPGGARGAQHGGVGALSAPGWAALLLGAACPAVVAAEALDSALSSFVGFGHACCCAQSCQPALGAAGIRELGTSLPLPAPRGSTLCQEQGVWVVLGPLSLCRP